MFEDTLPKVAIKRPDINAAHILLGADWPSREIGAIGQEEWLVQIRLSGIGSQRHVRNAARIRDPRDLGNSQLGKQNEADAIVGPPLNIGITNEGGDWTRDGTYAYPGSLTLSKSTFVALYVDVLRSLHDNGLRRAFLYIGHLGTRHVEAVVQVVEEANRRIDGMSVYATIDSEMLERMKLASSSHILSVEKGRNFEMVARLLGQGTELPRTTHADGAETSWTLYFYPHVVRPGYERFPQTPSSRFLEVLSSGDRAKNPSGSGGFPFDKASAEVGKQIVDYKTARIGEAILQVLRAK